MYPVFFIMITQFITPILQENTVFLEKIYGYVMCVCVNDYE